MKANYHTHSTWCDGKSTPEEIVLAALDGGFAEIGFSSHAMLPGTLLDWGLNSSNIGDYIADIRALAAKYDGRIKVLCGVEADYVPGVSVPDRAVYPGVDYIIGSVHFVVAPDGAKVPVDKSPESLAEGIAAHFSSDPMKFVSAYYSQVREMIGKFDFDIVGHIDLVRKFNALHPYFSETDGRYGEEIAKTARVAADSGKIVEINTGAISRGWMDDAYPSTAFISLLSKAGARFVLGSDSHSADTLDASFGRFASAGGRMVHFLERPGGALIG